MTKKSPYMGITHGVSSTMIDDPRFVEAWKKNRCSKGQHLWDEVWDGKDHCLSCDVCNLLIYIDRIDTSWVEDDGPD